MKYVESARRLFLETGTMFPREIIRAFAMVKLAAARVNVTLGLLDREIGNAIVNAAREVMNGKYDHRVIVDVFQTGSGTGLNMNINELIAEIASSSLRREVHANDHVNMGQSSNDVGPTAIRIAAACMVNDLVLPALNSILKSLDSLRRRTSRVYKAGRTHLRDALPITMGQEFSAYLDAFKKDRQVLRSTLSLLLELPIGGTAVGTGLNSHPRFGILVSKDIAKETRIRFRQANNRFRAMKLLTDISAVSSAMSLTSIDLYRLCQDLRLMFSGPMTGLNEIDIPTQREIAGSSIMPGKTNPVTVESAMLACIQVIGLNQANQLASLHGEFELSMGIPLVGYNIIIQGKLIAEALKKISDLVLLSLVPNTDIAKRYAESSQALITLLAPKIGYDNAAQIGKRVGPGFSIRDALKELGYDHRKIRELLNMRSLTKAGIPVKKFQ